MKRAQTDAFIISSILLPLCACSLTSSLEPASIVSQQRLETQTPEIRATTINTATFNDRARPATVATYRGFIGDLIVTYPADTPLIASDLKDISDASDQPFDPNERVRVDFGRASLNTILEHLLRGALKLNYFAPENLPTIQGFRIETPVPKSRILQIVRDLLARNNLVLANVNGIYHVGTAEVIEALRATSRAGRASDGQPEIFRLQRANAAAVADLAHGLLPPDVTLVDGGAGDTLIIRAPTGDTGSIKQLLKLLSEAAANYPKMAVLPLQAAVPESVAAKIRAFFAETLRNRKETLTVISLSSQKALLVGTSSTNLMQSVRRLVAQLDRASTNDPEIRAIALTHLTPAEIVPQLREVFSGDISAKLAATPSDSIPANDTPETAATPTSSAGNSPRIVADERTNSILVYADYTTFLRIRDAVQMLDVAQAQIVLEATVIEVTLNETVSSGVRFILGRRSGAPGIAASAMIGSENELSVNGDLGIFNVGAAISALATQTMVKVVATPYLTVLDGKTAQLLIGDQVPFATSSETTDTEARIVTRRNITVKDTGIALKITPRIHANDSISLSIEQSVSSMKGPQTSDLTPTISTRQINSQVLAQSGRTILLGGLIRQDGHEEGGETPGLRKLPVLGKLFGHKAKSGSRTELMILLTPRVARSSTEIEDITRMLRDIQSH